MESLTPPSQIDRRVEIAVYRVAAGADEHSVFEGQRGVACSAVRADLTRGVPTVCSDNGSPTPFSLVVQLSDECSPARVTNRTGEAVVAKHPENIAIFNNETVVSIDHRIRDSMQEMSANIQNMRVVPGQP